MCERGCVNLRNITTHSTPTEAEETGCQNGGVDECFVGWKTCEELVCMYVCMYARECVNPGKR